MPRLKTEDMATLSIRLPARTLDQLTTQATQAGISRTEYLLSWLPETHDGNPPQAPNTAAKNTR